MGESQKPKPSGILPPQKSIEVIIDEIEIHILRKGSKY